MNGNTDDSNDAPATLPQHDTTPWLFISEIIFANTLPPTVSTALVYIPLSNALTGSDIKSFLDIIFFVPIFDKTSVSSGLPVIA